jgi:hypothetical protein
MTRKEVEDDRREKDMTKGYRTHIKHERGRSQIHEDDPHFKISGG